MKTVLATSINRFVRASLIRKNSKHLFLRQSKFFVTTATGDNAANHTACKLTQPSGRLQNAYKANQSRQIELFKFSTRGDYSRISMKMPEMLRACSLSPRDVLALNTWRTVPIVQPLNESIVLSISHVRAVIKKDELFILNPERPLVLQFAQDLSEFLQV